MTNLRLFEAKYSGFLRGLAKMAKETLLGRNREKIKNLKNFFPVIFFIFVRF